MDEKSMNSKEEQRMFKLVAKHRFERNCLKKISDRDLDAYDVREWEILPNNCFTRHPLCVIRVAGKDNNEEIIPVYNMQDLEKLSISTSGHIIKPSNLTNEQKLWIQAEQEGNEIFSEEK